MVHRLLDIGLADDVEATAEVLKKDKLIEATVTLQHCNVMKATSKAAQDYSDQIYLRAYLKGNAMYVDDVVVGTGPKSFSALLICLGQVERLYVDRMKDTRPQYNEERKVLTLLYDKNIRDKNKQALGLPVMSNIMEMSLSICDPVVIRVANIDNQIVYSLVCLGTCALSRLSPANFPSPLKEPATAPSHEPYIADTGSPPPIDITPNSSTHSQPNPQSDSATVVSELDIAFVKVSI